MNLVAQFALQSPARWSSAIVWTLLLTLVLLQPEANPIINLGLPRGGNAMLREVFFNALHMLAFALTVTLWFWTLRHDAKPLRSLFGAILIAVTLGILTEAMQTFTLDRHASLIDLLANIGGVLIAARLIWGREF